MEDDDKEQTKKTMEQLLTYTKSLVRDINWDKVDSGRQGTNANVQSAKHSQPRSDLGGGEAKIFVGTTSVPDDPATSAMFQVPFLRELGYLVQTNVLYKRLHKQEHYWKPKSERKVKFVNLNHHINDGKPAGCSDKEKVAGVLKAIIPNLRLRNIL